MKRCFIIFVLSIIVTTATFSTTRAERYNLYIGGTHSHTSISDGSLLPKDAYDTARNKGGVDFWYVTDHYQSIGMVNTDPSVPKNTKEWDYELEVAREKNEDGVFLALVGWEWSDGDTGHMNVLFDDTEPPDILLTGVYETFISNWLKKHPDAITGFNHPLWSEDDAGLDNFHDFKMNKSIARQTVYMEISFLEEVHYFYRALDKGWWLAPLAAQDNHSPDWALRPEFVCVYAEELSEEALRTAFLARRFYSTTDRNMQLDFKGNGEPMGWRLKADNLDLEISFNHKENKVPVKVQLVTNGATIVKEWTPTSGSFNYEYHTEVTSELPQWYVVYIENKDGTFALSAPITVKTKE